jgi:nucleotide-binding universal stress UspA family protein
MADIVLGYDDSESANAALDVAVDIAHAFGDRIVASYGYAPPDRLRGEEYKEHERARRELGEAATANAIARVGEAEVELEVELVPQKPADALIALTEEREARMIVVGTHGEGPLASALLGSVPHKLLHRSRVPVLVVPAA